LVRVAKSSNSAAQPARCGTRFGRKFTVRVNGEEHAANTNDRKFPAALVPGRSGRRVSTQLFPRKSHARVLGQFRRTVSKPGLEPLFTFPNPFNGMSFYGLGPGDFATIYNSKPLIAAGNDGTGQTIAIVGRPTSRSRTCSNSEKCSRCPRISMPRMWFEWRRSGHHIHWRGRGGRIWMSSGRERSRPDNGKACRIGFDAVLAGIDLSALYIVEHNLAGVMSESYGTCENALGSAETPFTTACGSRQPPRGSRWFFRRRRARQVATTSIRRAGPHRGWRSADWHPQPFNVLGWRDGFRSSQQLGGVLESDKRSYRASAKSYIPEIPWSENCAQIGLTGCGASAPSGSLNIAAGSGGASSVYGNPTGKWVWRVCRMTTTGSA